MLFSSFNVQLDRECLEKIKNKIKENHFIENEFYTSYTELSNNYEFIKPFYSDVVENIIKKLGLYHISQYDWEYWIQMYNSNTDSHTIHNHFSGSEIISWVHFVKTTGQKCFYFNGENKTKFYPEDQNDNDLIVFPSYLFHGVDPIIQKNKNRIVVAGNIFLRSIDCVDRSSKLFSNKIWNTTIWTEISNH